jgi:glyoxylase-like metal-dependent hydrolase (beta-lactamase superfamily II)
MTACAAAAQAATGCANDGLPPLQRRAALASLATAAACVVGALGGCATIDAGPPKVQSLAPGVYLLPGATGAAEPDNLGRIGNIGFIVGPSGVIVIDTGTSYAHAQVVLAAIARVTDRPVKLALVTHVRPEFVFGGSAFRERGIAIRMHSRSARLMAARCELCLKVLRQTLGDAAMHDTAMYKPDQEFDEPSHLLELIGRPVRVLHFGHSSGPGDIAVLDEQSGVLFAGGLLDTRRVPDIQDSELASWQHALVALHALHARVVVPGHGAAIDADIGIAAVETYLRRLEEKVRSLVDSGASLIDVGEAAELPEFARWDQYDTIHRRNASIAFLRFERELMFKSETMK